jgi:hypothetical protein
MNNSNILDSDESENFWTTILKCFQKLIEKRTVTLYHISDSNTGKKQQNTHYIQKKTKQNIIGLFEDLRAF